MADNSMQANLGLSYQIDPSTGMVATPSPAQTAAMLSQQAMQQLSTANQQMQAATQLAYSNPSINIVANQIQRQLSNIQANMRMSMPEQLPSSLTTFPAAQATGQFLPMPSQQMAPLPRIQSMPMISTPFTPQLPAPMFRTAWEQEMESRQGRMDQIGAMVAQAPNIAGQGIAYGAAGLMGARMLGGFGGIGRLAGFAGGAALAGMSGAAQGFGGLAAMPFRPYQQDVQGAADLQRMSTGWLLGGPDVNQTGAGLGRGPAFSLSQSIGTMAGSPGFKQETGGMFNRSDLMQIMSQAGQAGLMDQSQNIGAIRENLRQTARTIREFMELTNDPDVSNVIRTMGQLRNIGMDVVQMRTAAQNIRLYSRSAGVSMTDIAGAGAGGAQAFSAAGLGPDIGFGAGMQALASARQAVASGSFTPRQLSMLGGVQGLTANSIQAQAATLSMPTLGMAVGEYTPQGWQAAPGAMQDILSRPGAIGPDALRKRAKDSMQQAFKRGGAQALALWPIQQMEVASQAAAALTPEEMGIMPYQLALAAGREAGLQGRGALAAGARVLYGSETAQQMLETAANPEYWKEQRRGITERRRELAATQRAQREAAAPGPWSRLAQEYVPAGVRRGFGRFEAGVEAVGGAIGRFPGRVAGRAVQAATGIQDIMDEQQGIVTTRRQTVPLSEAERRTALNEAPVMQRLGMFEDISTGPPSDIDLEGGLVHRMRMLNDPAYRRSREQSQRFGEIVPEIAGALSIPAMFIPGAQGIGAALGVVGLVGSVAGDYLRAADEAVLGNYYENQQSRKQMLASMGKTKTVAADILSVFDSSAAAMTDKNKSAVAKTLGIDEVGMEELLISVSQGFRQKFSEGKQPASKEAMKASLIETLRNNPKIGNAADSMVAALEKSGRLDKLLGEGVRGAKALKGAPEKALADAEEEHRIVLSKITAAEIGWSVDAIAKTTERMGQQIFGEELWRDQSEELTETFRGMGGATVAGVVGILQGRGPHRIREMYERAYGPINTEATKKTYANFLRGVKDQAGNLPQGVQDALRKVSRVTPLSDVVKLAELPRLGAARESVLGFLTNMGTMPEGAAVEAQRDPFALAALYKTEDIAKLEAAGTGTIQGAFGRFLRETKGYAGSTGTERERLRKEGLSWLGKVMGPEERVTKDVAAQATGSEAERLGTGEKAVTSAQMQFTTIMEKFGPSVDKFNAASVTYIEAARQIKDAAPLIKAAVEKTQ